MTNVTWVACSSDKADVWSGSFCTPAPEARDDPTISSGNIDFGSGVFTTPPRVLMGINRFEPDEGKDVGIRVRASNVTVNGMTW